jgi:hypothetical protein
MRNQEPISVTHANEEGDRTHIPKPKLSASNREKKQNPLDTVSNEHIETCQASWADTVANDERVYLSSVFVERVKSSEFGPSYSVYTIVIDPATGNERKLRHCILAQQAEAEYNALVALILQKGYSGTLKKFSFKVSTFRRTRDQFLDECPPNIDHLPSEPTKWPGLRRANLVQFLEVNYGRYIGNGLTMEHIKKKDLELYRTIYYYKKHRKLPFEIPARPQLLDTKLEKFWQAGKDALTPQERGAVTKKLERSATKR